MRNVWLVLFARLLHLSLDRSWAVVHPSRKQSQPPAYFAALLVNRIVGASTAPAVSHLKPLPHFTDCLWELRRQPRLPLVRKTPLAAFGVTFLKLEQRKLKILGKILRKCFFWTQSGKIWSVLHFLGPHSAAFLRHSAEAGATRRFLCRKVHILGLEILKKKADFGRKPYVNISGFLRQFCRRFSKVKIHLLMVQIAFFSVLSAHPRSCRPFPP